MKATELRIDPTLLGFESRAPLGLLGEDTTLAEFKAVHAKALPQDRDLARYPHPYSCPICGMGCGTAALATACCQKPEKRAAGGG